MQCSHMSQDTTQVTRWLALIQAEYREMPGLKLTRPQMQRLWGFGADACEVLIAKLLSERVLRRADDDTYVAFRSSR